MSTTRNNKKTDEEIKTVTEQVAQVVEENPKVETEVNKESTAEKAKESISTIVAAAEEAEVDVHELRKAEEVKTLIYVGPSLPGHILPQYSTFTSGVPIHVKEEIKKCPFIQELIVPVTQLAEVNGNLTNKGSKDQIMYEKVSEFYKGGTN